jgi:replicative DNA helicase
LTPPRPLDETPSLSALDISTRTTRVQLNRGLGMIVIDYLQLMSSPHKRRENRQQEVSDISRDLKMLARDLHVPVMALSQLSRDIESRHPPVPVLSDLRDSGAIEQDADLVLFIYRGDIYQPTEAHIGAQLILAKQRNGPVGEVYLAFQSTFARFVERVNPHHERQVQARLL